WTSKNLAVAIGVPVESLNRIISFRMSKVDTLPRMNTISGN
ncbi:hypothetical protein ACMD2_20166, partial [Ananas comosus]